MNRARWLKYVSKLNSKFCFGNGIINSYIYVTVKTSSKGTARSEHAIKNIHRWNIIEHRGKLSAIVRSETNALIHST